MELQRPAARPAWWRASLRARRACHRKVQNNPGVMVLRHLQWNRATAIRCRGWARGAHAPSRAAVDASSTAPTRASARDPAWPGTRDFGMSPANRRRAGFPTCVPWPSRNGCERGCAPQATGFLLFGHKIPLKTGKNQHRLPNPLLISHVPSRRPCHSAPAKNPFRRTGRGQKVLNQIRTCRSS